MKLPLAVIRRLHRFFYLIPVMISISCSSVWGNHPSAFSNRKEIAKAPPTVTQIAIPFLPIEDYGDLNKFKELIQVSYFSVDGTGGSDEKMQALSKLSFPKFIDLNLLNSPLVTDAGIKHLARIKSLRMMQLEGTSITDAGLKIIAEEMKLTGVNVANCPKVTFFGIKMLAQSKSLDEMGISSDNLSQEQIIKIIKTLESTKYFSVVDSKKKLDKQLLENIAAKKGVQFVLMNTGAIQHIDK